MEDTQRLYGGYNSFRPSVCGGSCESSGTAETSPVSAPFVLAFQHSARSSGQTDQGSSKVPACCRSLRPCAQTLLA